jgi:hypothetical protein
VQPHRLRLDGDAALALEVHRVEELRAHLALADRRASSRRRSASVDLPWSMCAMMEKLRMRSGFGRKGARLFEKVDMDYDGKFDLSAVYDPKTGVVAEIERDSDFDGKYDLKELYDTSGKLTSVRIDRDGNGEPTSGSSTRRARWSRSCTTTTTTARSTAARRSPARGRRSRCPRFSTTRPSRRSAAARVRRRDRARARAPRSAASWPMPATPPRPRRP